MLRTHGVYCINVCSATSGLSAMYMPESACLHLVRATQASGFAKAAFSCTVL